MQRNLNQPPVNYQSGPSFAQPLSQRRSALITQDATTSQQQTSPAIVYNTPGGSSQLPVNFQSGASRMSIAQPWGPITLIPHQQTSSAIVNNRLNLNQQPVSLQSVTPYPKPRSATVAALSTPQLPRELEVSFGGDRHPLGWNTLGPSVERLIEKLADIHNNNNNNNNSLTITWHPSTSDERRDLNRRQGGMTFKSLFDRLSREIKPGRTALTSFMRLSINVSEALEDLDILPITGPERTDEEDDKIDEDKIDLSPASNVKELLLTGSHMFFSEKLSNFPGQNLTLLSVTCCKISVNDTLVLLQVCPRLKDVTFATVAAESACELGNQYTPRHGIKIGSKLDKFTITSAVDVSYIVRALNWGLSPIIAINILDDAVAAQNWVQCFAKTRIPMGTELTMKGNFPPGTESKLRKRVPDVVFER